MKYSESCVISHSMYCTCGRHYCTSQVKRGTILPAVCHALTPYIDLLGSRDRSRILKGGGGLSGELQRLLNIIVVIGVPNSRLCC